jgi:hypothetical protein
MGVQGPTRNDYEASGVFGVRTEGPKGELGEGKPSSRSSIYAPAHQGLEKKLDNPRS